MDRITVSKEEDKGEKGNRSDLRGRDTTKGESLGLTGVLQE